MPFALTLERLFASRHAEDAMYHPKVGPAFAVRVMAPAGDTASGYGQSEVLMQGTGYLEVLGSAFAGRTVPQPEEGDVIVLADGAAKEVKAEPRVSDPRRLKWLLDTQPVV